MTLSLQYFLRVINYLNNTRIPGIFTRFRLELIGCISFSSFPCLPQNELQIFTIEFDKHKDNEPTVVPDGSVALNIQVYASM